MHNYNGPEVSLYQLIDDDIIQIETTLDEIMGDVTGAHRIDLGKLARLEKRLARQREELRRFRDTITRYAWNKDLEKQYRFEISGRYTKKMRALQKKAGKIQELLELKNGFGKRLSRIEEIAAPIKRFLLFFAGFAGAVLGLSKLPPYDGE